MQTILAVWMVATGFALLFFASRVSRFYEVLRDLRDVEPHIAGGHWPRVSIVVPACNEAGSIKEAVESLLQLDYPALEFVLVDDRSTDGTTAILQELAKSDERIKIIEIKILPDGWLGKVHALYSGQKAASGEWILFTDADVHHAPQSLRKAITVCVEQTLDFLCVAPTIKTRSAALKIFIAQFFQNACYSVNLKHVLDPRRPDSLGAGAYNLIHKATLERSKGFEWLRLEVCDDLAIAQVVKEAGARLGVVGGIDEVALEWYPDLKGFIRGVEKNSFSVFQYSLPALISFIALSWLIVGGFTVAPLLATKATISEIFVFGCLVLYLAITGFHLPRSMTGLPWAVIGYPITMVGLPLIVLRAALLTRKQNGIYWRGTFYGLTELKRNQRLRPFDMLMGR